ncbi:A-kinase anchor protein 8-like isoform X1 [Sinocyclocheilus rhinocerous]|uniref:A-kinase anchor protein 8-like isoform X1 n=1 Tax=Sinocyclocheilus rhinocerous TaxID=307959 RepID=UPI0007BAA3E9|nr:PREDICTED: A-kinase anchor protein 8-like isoform X1 [Sinocyclocheilus rhinocerous]
MDRGYSSGFSGWGGSGGGGSSRGSGGYDLYGYKDSMSSSGGFGGGGYGSSDRMKRGLSGGSLLSSSGSNADDVIAKINQRLDMLTQLEGGMKSGARGDRFAQYESFDSRSTSLGPRDLYRSGSFGFSDSRGDMMAQRGGVGFGVMGGAGGGGGGFDGSAFGSAKMRPTRDSAFSGSGWGAGQRSPRRNRSAGGRGFGRRQDSSSTAGMGGGSGRGGGHQGHSPAGRGKLPSLLANRMYPDSGAFQSQRGPQDFPARNFGGGPRANRQHGRKRPQNRQVKAQRDGQKKRKQTLSATDEPESKMGKTEATGEASASDAAAGEQTQESEEATAATAVESKTEDGGEGAAPSNQDESAKAKGKKTPPSAAKARKRRGFFERSGVKVSAHRMTFACSICKFRSFYSEDMAVHLESKFHKDHFKFLSNQLSKPTTDFLQEYLNNKYTKTEQRVSQMDNHSTVICQVFKEQDLTRDLGMEHFMKKVEAAHCSACDVFIPMQYTLIQKHLKSPDHNYNRKGMMEQSKRSSLSVARSILNHKVIGKKLESYLKGEDPFNGNQDDQDPEDSMVMEVSEADLTSESLNEIKQEEEGPLAEGAEPAAEAVGNGEEHEEEVKMETGGAAEEGVEEGEEGVEVGEEEAAEHGVDAGAAGDADAAAAE